MKLHVYMVGGKQPDWIRRGCEEYLKRMPRDFSTTLTEIKPEARNSGKSIEQIRMAEKGRIEERLAGHSRDRIVALDERGLDITTQQLSRQLEIWSQVGNNTCFLIGGPDGLDPALKASAEALWRLSSLTLPHGMACLLLCEQLYRAVSIIKGHPYHRQ